MPTASIVASQHASGHGVVGEMRVFLLGGNGNLIRKFDGNDDEYVENGHDVN